MSRFENVITFLEGELELLTPKFYAEWKDAIAVVSELEKRILDVKKHNLPHDKYIVCAKEIIDDYNDAISILEKAQEASDEDKP